MIIQSLGTIRSTVTNDLANHFAITWTQVNSSAKCTLWRSDHLLEDTFFRQGLVAL